MTVLVLVTVLAALVAPHARALRGKLADVGPLPAVRLPKPSPRSPAGDPGAQGAELHQRGRLPAGRRLPLAAA